MIDTQDKAWDPGEVYVQKSRYKRQLILSTAPSDAWGGINTSSVLTGILFKGRYVNYAPVDPPSSY
jgi:hypothetical protein